jgi:hypothetical protein
MLSGIALDAVLTRVGDSGTQKAPRCCWPGPGRREILADQAVAPLFAALSLRIWLAAFFHIHDRDFRGRLYLPPRSIREWPRRLSPFGRRVVAATRPAPDDKSKTLRNAMPLLSL